MSVWLKRTDGRADARDARRSRSSDTRGSSLGNSPMQLVASFVSLQLVLTLQCSVGVDTTTDFPRQVGGETSWT